MKAAPFIALFLICSIFLQAQTVTWDGGGIDDDWHDPLNWDTNIVPGSGDEVIIGDFYSVSIYNGDATVRRVKNEGTLTVSPGRILTINAPGEVALETTGSVAETVNQGTIKVNNAGSYGIYVALGSSFINEGAGIINCCNISTGTGIYIVHSGSNLSNEATINIVSNVKMGVNIESGGSIANATSGVINITSIEYGLRCRESIDNYGMLNIVDAGNQGIWCLNCNIVNQSSGTIKVQTCGGDQIQVRSNSTFDNYGTVELLETTGAFKEGITLSTNTSQFINRSTGQIIINKCTWDGVYLAQGSTFDNSGEITISNSIGRNGIYNNSTFNNLAGGTINISDTATNGIYNNKPINSNDDVVITNDGTINLISNIGDYGIKEGISGTSFYNNSSGLVSIDGTGNVGIIAPFLNYGTLELKSGIGGLALGAFGVALNQTCGRIISEKNIYECAFINQGTIISQYTSSSITANANFINQGIIEDLVGPSSIAGLNNSGYRVTNITGIVSESEATIAFDQGVGASGIVANILWFTDAARTIPAGVYVPLTNEWVPNTAAVGLSTFYLTVELLQGCSSDIMVNLDNAVLGSPSKYIEGITENGLWNDPGTWDLGIVPRAGDEVYSSFSLIVPSGYDAKAKSLTIVGDLTVEPNSSLVIYDSDDVGLINDSEVFIHGRLVVNKSVNEGIQNNFFITISECGELYLFESFDINNVINNGYLFQNYSGNNFGFTSFVNNGVIEDFQNSFDGILIANNEVILKPKANSLFRGEPLSDALDIDMTANLFQISDHWYLEPSKLTSAGTYNQSENVWIPNENAVGATIFFMEVNTIGGTCSVIMKVNLENPILECSNGSISLNAGFTDFYDTLSWDLNRLPTACDFLNIPLATDDLSLPAMHEIEYRGIDNNGTLTILLGTEVSIPDADGIAINNTGDIVNSGLIDISNSNSEGIRNAASSASFLNNNSISIMNTGEEGIVNSQGTFTNNTLADIYIYNAGTVSVYNSSLFNNLGDLQMELGDVSILNHDYFYSEGSITCQSADDYSIFNTSNALFENIGSISSSGSTTFISFWNTNGSTFENGPSGDINITGTFRSIINSGVMTEIYNYGTITIGNTTQNFINDNNALFTNMTQGTINNSNGNRGLENKTGASFINKGEFNVSDMSSYGINNSANFTNDTGGILNIDDVQVGFYNSSSMTNKGIVNIGPNLTLRHFFNTGNGILTCKNGSQFNALE